MDFDPFSAEMREDPYPAYRWLRDQAPVYHSKTRGFWALSRYEEISTALRSTRQLSTAAAGEDIDDTGSLIPAGNFLEADPPLHTALRSIVSSFFAPRDLRRRLRPVVEREVDALVAELAAEEAPDLASQFAWRLPISVVAHMLGLEMNDRARLRHLIDILQRKEAGQATVDDVARGAAAELADYFAGVVEDRRKNPRDDVLTMVSNALVDGRPIGSRAVGMSMLLFVAATDTAACLITNGLNLLRNHPDQRAWLASHPSAIEGAVEEILRYESPVQNAKRTVVEEIVLNGVTIPEGAPLFLFFGSANRDETRVAASEVFDVTRQPAPHLAFGAGIHRCIGAPIARLEGQLAINAILKRWPNYEVRGSPTRIDSNVIRGLTELPATLS